MPLCSPEPGTHDELVDQCIHRRAFLWRMQHNMSSLPGKYKTRDIYPSRMKKHVAGLSTIEQPIDGSM